MANACRTMRLDTDFKQILLWSRCGAVSRHDVGQRLSRPTDLQQLQILKMFGAYPNMFISVWLDTHRQCRV